MSNFRKQPIAMAIGTAFALSGLSAHASSSDTVFRAAELPSGYTLLAEGKCGEGKCGEGRCGEAKFKKMDTDGDGKLTMEEFMAGHKAAQGKDAEGKCGEGKCGEKK